MDGFVNNLVDGMFRFIGRTVTIFTTSGGLSGAGFSGVLLSVDCNVVRLLVDEGAAPACPIGSCCTGPGAFDGWGGRGNWGGFGGWGNSRSFSCGCEGNPLGAVCVIPTCAIACFTHNAI